jgi:RNA polymerase sigma-70 factor, ECF subfamily
VPHSEPTLTWNKQQIEAKLQQAKHGSIDARGSLLEACRNYLLRLANDAVSGALRAKCAASDLVQETSLDAQRDFDCFHGERLEKLLVWLRQILLCNSATVRLRYEKTEERKFSRELPGGLASHGQGELADDALSPSSLLAAIEEEQNVERASD